jgi:DNA polymerase (family 10)
MSAKIKRQIVDALIPSMKRAVKNTIDYLSKTKKRTYKAKIEAVGSYRRGVAQLGDIDFLVTVVPADPDFARTLFAVFKKRGVLLEELSLGETKASGNFAFGKGAKKLVTQIDFLITTPLQHPFALLYFTGSKGHNILMRARAKKMGLTLNEYGFKSMKTGEYLTKINAQMKSEQDIFKIIKMEYVKPEDRFAKNIDTLS